MRRKNKEINIFSMSALDLFASAMGAFILIAVIALPYYLKADPDLEEKYEALQEENAEKDLENIALQEDNAEKDLENIALQEDNAEKDLENQTLREDNAENHENNLALQAKATALQKELEQAIKFSLLGIETRASSFVVVIDLSGSVKQYTAILENTFERIIEPLSDDISLQIIGYQGRAPKPKLHPWQPEHTMEYMTPRGKSTAIQFVKELIPKMGDDTPTREALKAALKYDAEAIILLSDGEPNTNAGRLVTEITQLNDGQKEIHAVAIGKYQSDVELIKFLQDLASKNEGSFLGVSN